MAHQSDAQRDLLFGFLALQTGLIDLSQLVAAFPTGTLGRGRALAEILVERGDLAAEDRSLLEAMADRQLMKHGGDAEETLASIAVGRSTRETLAGLGDTDLTASLAFIPDQSPTEVADNTPSLSIGTVTSQGGRFRVLRPHAKGGLGAVFVALDGELNREVALKQILDHHADDQPSRARFLLEAEITGGLEHPGIVPVYGLGHHADGRPYYAMRFIRGDSLKEAITAFHADESLRKDPGKRSLALRKLLRRFGDVCNAIDYAHGRGVLHRDIKPGNIIVGEHGETLVVDWGLAKAMGRSEPMAPDAERTLRPSSSSGSAETLPGQAIGTPAFMSPEQASGDLERLGPRSDVYSLGATLYALLTGRQPFEGKDLGKMLRDVRQGVFPPPRQADPSIDPALEAVCLKAMATDPAARYPSARALAEDVERWAADEPTSAWVEPFSVKARRWMRRNRSVATAVAASVLVAMVGLSAVLAVRTRANEVLTAKNAELAMANAREASANAQLRESNASVQARFDLAREAIRSFQDGVNEDEMLKGKELKGLRDKLLRSAAGFYEKLEKLLQGQADRTSRASLAQSYHDLGELIEKIGIQPEALAVRRKALAIRRELADGPDADAASRLDLARSLIATGTLAGATGDTSGALAAFEEARSLALPLASGPGSTDAARDVLSTSHSCSGALLSTTGKLADALQSHRRALAIQQELVADHPADVGFRGKLADGHRAIGILQLETGHPDESLESHRRALAIQRELVDDHPADISCVNKLGRAYNIIGWTLAETGHHAEALESHRRALAIQRELVDDHPAVTGFRILLAYSHDRIGVLQWEDGSLAEALESQRRALAIQQKLVDDNPAVPEFRSRLADYLVSSGYLKLNSGDLGGASEAFDREAAAREKLAEEHPDDRSYQNNLANCLTNLATVLNRLGRPPEARRRCERAATLREALIREMPDVPRYRYELAETFLRSGQAREAEGDPGGSLADARRAVALFDSASSSYGETTFLNACAHALLASLAGKAGSGISAEEGKAEAERAMALLHRAITMGYRYPGTYRNETGLDSLRPRPDFRLLMSDLAFPASPFAR